MAISSVPDIIHWLHIVQQPRKKPFENHFVQSNCRELLTGDY